MNGPSLFSFGSKYFKGVLALILAATFTTSPLLADFKDDIDYTKLKNEYGSGLPSGSGVKLAQIEYIRGGYWAPSATGELAGKSFTYVTDTFGGYSTHANEVGAYLSGNVTSVTPGVAGWSCFEATNYCGSQSLMIGISAAPIVATWDVENHSWVGNDISFCVETLKRMDYRIERDNVIAVVGLDNGAATPLSNMMANAYNVIAVGTSTGDHPHGGSTLEVLGRQKPDLVGTATWTSYATPIVASSATLLVDETKRTTSLAQARHPLVIKALLMAGATKEEFSGWSHTSAQPLDAIYGAGEVNVYNSYKTLIAGRQQASSTSLLNISGWDTQTTTATKKLYYINVPAGKTLQLSAVLAWYRHVQPDSGWNTLVSVVNNLNLTLWNADSSYNLLSKVSESLSTIDNVEHIYEKTLGAGVYALEVVAPVAGEKYGLAWRGVYSDGTTSVNVAPAITTQPVAQTVTAGTSVTFSAAASGTPTPSYQWYKNGATISGATSASYTIASASLSDAATYTVVATNSVSSATSSGATLSVNVATVAPAITTQPVAQSVVVGSSVTFSVAASGTPTPSYQWYKNGATISGATSASYTIASTSLSDAATYTVVATNSVSSATSNGATLTVSVATVAPAITTQPVSQTVTVGSSVTFSATASGTPTPSYQWYKNGATISGATGASYWISSVSLSDAATYTVVATNSVSSATSSGATLTVNVATVAPAITTQPIAQSVVVGSGVTFNAAASGTPTPSYQWYKNGATISGATSASYTIASTSLSDAATYTVVATNSVSSATSNGATLTVSTATVAPAITTQPVSQTVTAGSNVTFNVAASGTPTPSYQWYKNGAAISGAIGTSFWISGVSLSDAATYTVVATNSVSSATSSGATLTVNVATVAPAITTQPVAQSVVVGSSVTFNAAASGTPTPSYQWYKNGAAISGATSASYTIASTSLSDAATYAVVATNNVSSATSSGAILTVNVASVAPAITTQPVAQSVTVGSNVTFNVAASGTPTPSYQWYKNAVAISGATGTSYWISSVSLGDAATYTVVATNSVSSATSSGATLTVNVATVAPAITTQPVSQTVTVGSGVTFSATASGTPAPSYRWYKNGAAISGATSANYTIASTSLSDAATYTVVATNSVSSATSSGATLTVNVATGSAPQITSTTLAGGAISEPFSYTTIGSNQPTSYAATGLPSGLTINTATGVITGSPTASGTFSVTLRATNGSGTGSATLSLSITPSVAVISFAGGTGASTVAGAQAATATTFSNPSDVAVDASGNLYVADTNNHVVRKITLSGNVTIVAGQSGLSGSSDASVATNARFNAPVGLVIDGSGNIFVSDTGNAVIRKISVAGVVTTLAGAAGVLGTSDGTGNAARFNQPTGLVIDSGGNLFVADTGNHSIRKVTSAGVVTTLAGISGYSGSADGLAGIAKFNRPADLVLDVLGDLYVADTGNHTIRKVTLSAGYATVSTIAGRAGVIGAADGVGAAALFNSPMGFTLDQNGDLYVSDTGNHVIRRVTPATGLVITLAGSAGVSGTVDGFGGNARLSSPMGLAADTTGDIYIADSSSQMIRQIGYYAAPSIQTQPQGQTVANGASASFSVVASGLPTASYQWYKDGAGISGATASTYSLTAAQASNAGSYTVVVSNAMGSVTSNAAALTVSSTTSAGGSTGSSSTTSGSGGGGGGAPSDYYLIALVVLGLSRIFSRKK